jgi:hypothetical protein
MGFEIVVRPVVFPDIRPAPARSLPPPDDPEKGFAVIRGNGAKSVSLGYSYSLSWSKSRSMESERRVDEVRVYQMDDDGTVNKDNFVDLEVANRIKMKEPGAPGQAGDVTVPGGSAGSKGTSYEIAMYYARQAERENIEIKNRDQIKKNTEAD